jgi:hypothetical protein
MTQREEGDKGRKWKVKAKRREKWRKEIRKRLAPRVFIAGADEVAHQHHRRRPFGASACHQRTCHPIHRRRRHHLHHLHLHPRRRRHCWRRVFRSSAYSCRLSPSFSISRPTEWKKAAHRVHPKREPGEVGPEQGARQEPWVVQTAAPSAVRTAPEEPSVVPQELGEGPAVHRSAAEESAAWKQKEPKAHRNEEEASERQRQRELKQAQTQIESTGTEKKKKTEEREHQARPEGDCAPGCLRNVKPSTDLQIVAVASAASAPSSTNPLRVVHQSAEEVPVQKEMPRPEREQRERRSEERSPDDSAREEDRPRKGRLRPFSASAFHQQTFRPCHRRHLRLLLHRRLRHHHCWHQASQSSACSYRQSPFSSTSCPIGLTTAERRVHPKQPAVVAQVQVAHRALAEQEVPSAVRMVEPSVAPRAPEVGPAVRQNEAAESAARLPERPEQHGAHRNAAGASEASGQRSCCCCSTNPPRPVRVGRQSAGAGWVAWTRPPGEQEGALAPVLARLVRRLGRAEPRSGAEG